MKFTPKQLIAASLLATLGFAASAQAPAAPGGPGGPGGPGAHGHRMDPARMQEFQAKRQERMARHQAELKQKLQITSAQEGAWSSFTAALKPAARPARPDREAIARMSTPDRIDHMRALRSQHIAESDRRGDATKAFYATLTADQKKVFDAETGKRHGGGPRGGHHHKG